MKSNAWFKVVLYEINSFAVSFAVKALASNRFTKSGNTNPFVAAANITAIKPNDMMINAIVETKNSPFRRCVNPQNPYKIIGIESNARLWEIIITEEILMRCSMLPPAG